MKTHWSTRKERGSPALIRGILWLAINLGRKYTRLLLFPITAYFFIFAGKARLASRAYLRRARKTEPHWWNGLKHIYYFSCTILDRVFLLSDNFDALDIHIHNDNILMKYIDNKQGCILLGSHLGSFDVLRAVGVSKAKIPLKVLMYQEQNHLIASLLDALNPEIAQTIIPLGKENTLLKVNECLQDGDVVAILGDRALENDQITHCDFLGTKARFPTGSIVLASILKAPIVLVYGLYAGKNRYDIYFELLAEKIELKNRHDKTEIHAWTQRYADRLAFYTEKYPYNWFNFYDFWRDQS